jgi:hypothetical protein
MQDRLVGGPRRKLDRHTVVLDDRALTSWQAVQLRVALRLDGVEDDGAATLQCIELLPYRELSVTRCSNRVLGNHEVLRWIAAELVSLIRSLRGRGTTSACVWM